MDYNLPEQCSHFTNEEIDGSQTSCLWVEARLDLLLFLSSDEPQMLERMESPRVPRESFVQ